jgi:mRNA interferase MazF
VAAEPMFRRAHLYWVRMPGEGKKRPALVLSHDVRNERSPTVVVIPCTTTQRLGPWHVRLARGEGGLRISSVLKCEDVTMLAKTDLLPEPIGRSLSSARMGEVRRWLLSALDFE